MGRMTFVTMVGIASLLGGQTVAKADPVGGPIVKMDSVLPRHIDTWKFMLRGNETTRIRLVGDGDTCLELRVFDEDGVLVAFNTLGMGDRRTIMVSPKWTGKYQIKVRNLGHLSNRYTLVLD